MKFRYSKNNALRIFIHRTLLITHYPTEYQSVLLPEAVYLLLWTRNPFRITLSHLLTKFLRMKVVPVRG